MVTWGRLKLGESHIGCILCKRLIILRPDAYSGLGQHKVSVGNITFLLLLLLVGGLEHEFYFSIIYGMSSFPLTNSYVSEGLKPSTR